LIITDRECEFYEFEQVLEFSRIFKMGSKNSKISNLLVVLSVSCIIYICMVHSFVKNHCKCKLTCTVFVGYWVLSMKHVKLLLMSFLNYSQSSQKQYSTGRPHPLNKFFYELFKFRKFSELLRIFKLWFVSFLSCIECMIFGLLLPMIAVSVSLSVTLLHSDSLCKNG